MTRRFFWLLAAISCSAILTKPTFAEDLSPSIIGATDQSQLQRLEKGLLKKVGTDFEDVPLKDALTQLFAADETPFYIDERALDLLGIGKDAPVTLKKSGLRVDQTLDLMLRPLELDWMPNRGLIMITSPEEVDANQTRVVYDIDDLSLPDGQVGTPFVSCTTPHFDSSLGVLLSRTVSPESWEELGGAGTWETWRVGGHVRLVVRQSYREHKNVERFLHELKTSLAAAKPPEKAEDSLSHRVYPLNNDDERFQTDEVEKLIRAVMPDRWNDETTIVAAAGTLVIKQTSATHKEITSLLGQLGALQYSTQTPFGDDGLGVSGGGGAGDEGLNEQGESRPAGGDLFGDSPEEFSDPFAPAPGGGVDPFSPAQRDPNDPNGGGDPFAPPPGGDPFGG